MPARPGDRRRRCCQCQSETGLRAWSQSELRAESLPGQAGTVTAVASPICLPVDISESDSDDSDLTGRAAVARRNHCTRTSSRITVTGPSRSDSESGCPRARSELAVTGQGPQAEPDSELSPAVCQCQCVTGSSLMTGHVLLVPPACRRRAAAAGITDDRLGCGAGGPRACPPAGRWLTCWVRAAISR